jgi:hypothetical protein
MSGTSLSNWVAYVWSAPAKGGTSADGALDRKKGKRRRMAFAARPIQSGVGTPPGFGHRTPHIGLPDCLP